ncbi:MAG: hypothetical protein NVS1B10_00920 [Candidatus Saccharimonadales bacterium]
MLDLVDTHCHIQSAGLDIGERSTRDFWAKDETLSAEIIVKNARDAGVNKLICVGCDYHDSKLAVKFVQTTNNAWASIGIHPHEAKEDAKSHTKLKAFDKLLSGKKIVAIGECGLDYYYNHSPREDQIVVLKYQIELALDQDLPLIFHVREALDDFWPICDSYKGLRGVLHSYTDTVDNLKQAVSRGLYIGVNGIATFTNIDKQLEMYKSIPLENLLLETDSPFLAPKLQRGRINQPKYLTLVAEFLSQLRGQSIDVIAKTTTANSEKLFGI